MSLSDEELWRRLGSETDAAAGRGMDRPLDGRLERLREEIRESPGEDLGTAELARRLAVFAEGREDPEAPSKLVRHAFDLGLALAALLLLVLLVRAASWQNVVAVARGNLPAGHVVQPGDLRLAPTLRPEPGEYVLRRSVRAGQRLGRRDLGRNPMDLTGHRLLTLAVEGPEPLPSTPRSVSLAVSVPKGGPGLRIDNVWILKSQPGSVTAALLPEDLDRLLPLLAEAKIFLVTTPAGPAPKAEPQG